MVKLDKSVMTLNVRYVLVETKRAGNVKQGILGVETIMNYISEMILYGNFERMAQHAKHCLERSLFQATLRLGNMAVMGLLNKTELETMLKVTILIEKKICFYCLLVSYMQMQI